MATVKNVPTPKKQLASFIAKYSPVMAKQARASVATMRKAMPGAFELVYDNYNWLVVGFSPTERPSDAVFSLAFAPSWVTLCFLRNARSLPDPKKLLRGSGNVVRSVRLASPKDLETPAIRALMKEALIRASVAPEKGAKGTTIVRAISARQRARRPTVS